MRQMEKNNNNNSSINYFVFGNKPPNQNLLPCDQYYKTFLEKLFEEIWIFSKMGKVQKDLFLKKSNFNKKNFAKKISPFLLLSNQNLEIT